MLATGVAWGADALTLLLGVAAPRAAARAARSPTRIPRLRGSRALRERRAAGARDARDLRRLAKRERRRVRRRAVDRELPVLRQLDLLNLSCTDFAARSLARSPTLTQLHGLDFGWGSYNANRIGAGGAEAIANSTELSRAAPTRPRLQRHRRRRLRRTRRLVAARRAALAPRSRTISSPTTACARSRPGPGMPKLELARAHVQPASSRTRESRRSRSRRGWRRCRRCGSARSRSVRTPRARSRGSPHARGLRDLNLLECQLGDEGARALLASPHLDGLAKLQLAGNQISADVRSALHARWGTRVHAGG